MFVDRSGFHVRGRITRFIAPLTLLVMAACATGCILRSPTRPIRVLEPTTLRGPAHARGLFVLLPGFGDGAEQFRDHGFMDLVRERTGHDVIAVDGHLGFYRVFNIVERLDEDVIGPALGAGYREVWLVGVSMGGFGALAYAAEHPERITGLILIAPYVGDPAVVTEVREAGGPTRWEPGDRARFEPGEPQKSWEIWAWLKERLALGAPPPIFLGYGEQDRDARSRGVLADALPDGHVRFVPGGHTWVVWRPLFQRLLPAALHATHDLKGQLRSPARGVEQTLD